MNNGKKMIERFPYEVKAQRAKKLWKEYEKENDMGTTLMVFTGAMLAFAIVFVFIMIFKKFDFHPLTGLVILSICAWVLIVTKWKQIKNWFQAVKRWMYGKR